MKFRFYIYALVYLFLLFGSIYGLFVKEISIGIGAQSGFNISLSGWSKNILCIVGLVLVSLMSAYPILSAVYNALSRSGK